MGLTLKVFRERLFADRYVDESRAMATVTRSDMPAFEKMTARRLIAEHYDGEVEQTSARKAPPPPSQSLLPATNWRGGPKPGIKAKPKAAPPPPRQAAPPPRPTLATPSPSAAARKRVYTPTGRPPGRPRTRPIETAPPPRAPYRPDPVAVLATKDCALAIAALLHELREDRTAAAYNAALRAAERLAVRLEILGAGPEEPPAATASEGDFGTAHAGGDEPEDDGEDSVSLRAVLDEEPEDEAAS